ncbi:M23 family metallopeptidase [Kordiimonas aestuarii]|uniref:M23 family metallopeptidase n=1 Tax=Kordiimonas aestuarii TaxID=1005925 RepID=UPI0021CE3930|nr:M23 family metallopeptidase [Kordiimonas aestuarii]
MKQLLTQLFAFVFFVASVGLPASAVELSGTAAQGGMLWGQVKPGVRVSLDGERVKVGPDGYFVIGFGRDAAATATLTVMQVDGTGEEQVIKVKARQFDIERVDGLPPKTVTPPPEWRERRARETGMVREARSHLTDALAWTRGFIRPAEGRFSGFYGSQRILNGEPRSPHYGLDIAGSVGTPIVAPAPGVVRLAVPDFLLEGGIIIIDHGFGVTSTLFHMNSVDVKLGDTVEQGEQIGTIGQTGRANGPHVDWRVNWRNVRLDPMLLIAPEPMKGPF